MKIVITSHGDLCSSLLHCYNVIAGDNSDIIAVPLTDSGIGEFSANLKKILDCTDKALVLCDLKGGTPYNESYGYMLAHPGRVKVVCGVNLPMLLETGLQMNHMELSGLALNALKTGKEGIDKAE